MKTSTWDPLFFFIFPDSVGHVLCKQTPGSTVFNGDQRSSENVAFLLRWFISNLNALAAVLIFQSLDKKTQKL